MRKLGAAIGALLLTGIGTACSGGGSAAAGAAAPQFTYSGATVWEMAGPVSGPFANASADFTLSNAGVEAVSWSATSVPVFVQLDRLDGSIQPGSSTTIHANLDPVAAQTLLPGEYSDVLRIHNETALQVDLEIGCRLSVTASVDATEFLPLTDFESSGPAGGPFQPGFVTYDLTETGNTSSSWQANVGDPWVSVSPTSGLLAPSTSVALTVGIKPAATASLSAGLHVSHVDIVDSASNNTLHTRAVALNVTPATTDAGWTVFTASPATRKVFVSSSQGSDSNSGLSQSSPKRSIAAGKELVRDGFPDWLLLKCGDTWDEAIGAWGVSGRSATEPILIGSYGTGERPFLRTGTSEAIISAYNTNPNYVSVVGLHFSPHLYNGSNGTPRGVFWLHHTTGFLLEDCLIERYWQNVVVQGTSETNGTQGPNRHSDVRIRRNVITDAYSTDNTGMVANLGLYVENCDGVLIEENLFDHNGWVDSIPGSRPTWYRHNGYVQNGNTGVSLLRNIIAGTDGVMMRSGGLIEDNLYLHNYLAILFGHGTAPEPNGVAGTIRKNVVLDGRDYADGSGASLAGGLCIDMGNISQSVIEQNIFAHNTSGTGPSPVVMRDDRAYNSYRVVENTTISNNIIYDWGGRSVDIQTSTGEKYRQPVNLRLVGNAIQNSKDTSPLVRHEVSASLTGLTSENNSFLSAAEMSAWFLVGSEKESLEQWKPQVQDTTSAARQVDFPAPNRTIGSYHGSIGKPPNVESFLAEARLQSRANWRPQYTARAVNDYIRAGFGL